MASKEAVSFDVSGYGGPLRKVFLRPVGMEFVLPSLTSPSEDPVYVTSGISSSASKTEVELVWILPTSGSFLASSAV